MSPRIIHGDILEGLLYKKLMHERFFMNDSTREEAFVLQLAIFKWFLTLKGMRIHHNV